MPDSTPSVMIERFTLGPFLTNCHLLRTDDSPDCWIVDAGFEPEPMIHRIVELRLKVVLIVLTHAHADHIAGLTQLRAELETSPPILIHEAESSWLADPALNLSAELGVPITAPDADRLLTGGEQLTLGGAAFDVLHTPGHSPGGITLYSSALGVALVGDTLFEGSIGRYDFPTSDGPTLFESIRQTLYALPDDTVVHPGHGPSTTIGVEKATNPFVRG